MTFIVGLFFGLAVGAFAGFMAAVLLRRMNGGGP